jgi:hypothetical protein
LLLTKISLIPILVRLFAAPRSRACRIPTLERN